MTFQSSIRPSTSRPGKELGLLRSLLACLGITRARDTTSFGPPNDQSHTSSPTGFNVGVGLLWALQQHVGLLAEYRYLAFHPNFQFGQAGKVDLHINTHLLLGGVSVRF